ncbi:hypothetical protein TTHERM_000415819 (macronuclear) [Tetrahymena thermophila SB210]|uniref:Uncharacterized protein n=1 Tax=Tetrahymena thermophila (strain SB210) TaxID=312017 RepID=W7XB32_TETTS|nr:hypothetical protein TTHERM_000415819 [Tetrahymena thermophila SB210]EWS76585.1 hypothetical protein TTHERM_000415819 [Tetrahymena thermophila SB210]|eukprot:XP_012650871.1 hypothetical protein TTHERM_000415819 [Tetrahymena thermophila SB210]
MGREYYLFFNSSILLTLNDRLQIQLQQNKFKRFKIMCFKVFRWLICSKLLNYFRVFSLQSNLQNLLKFKRMYFLLIKLICRSLYLVLQQLRYKLFNLLKFFYIMPKLSLRFVSLQLKVLFNSTIRYLLRSKLNMLRLLKIILMQFLRQYIINLHKLYQLKFIFFKWSLFQYIATKHILQFIKDMSKMS